MSMILCGREAVLDLMHPDYVTACEEQNPGLVAEYAGWEREETEGREGYRMTIHIDLGGEP